MEQDIEEQIDYNSMNAIELSEEIEKMFNIRIRKSTKAYQQHRKELNKLIDLYNNKFQKSYNYFK